MPIKDPSTKNIMTNDGSTNRVLRIVLLAIGGVLLLSILCCLCTLAVGWYTGDFIVDFLRSLFVK